MLNNDLASIFVAPCVSLDSELRRQPWLSESERIAAAVQTMVAHEVEEALAGMYTAEECEDAREDGKRTEREECVREIDAIMDRFDCEAADYGANVVEALNAWIKENS